MIYKTICFAVVLIVIYSLNVYKLKLWFKAQHQWQNNIVNAQQFIYTAKQTKGVIVGSSLSERIQEDQLEDVYNLSFSGLGIFDGLKILSKKHTSVLPKIIFIETNVLQRSENKEFSRNLFSPFSYYPKKWFSGLRDDRQPIGIAGHYLSSNLIAQTIFDLKHSEKKKFNQNITTSSNNLFYKLLQNQKKSYSLHPNQEILTNNLNTLSKYIKYFKTKNVQIVFFEMPIDISLYNLPVTRTIRESFYKYFPATDYRYICPPKDIYFKTNDGIHLTKQSAIIYTQFLKNQIISDLRCAN